ncbi:zinc-binding alcohol dehydrogenase [Georgenia daeguensis]|uniref:Zinc-binding alcohol dehydrogenase n=1 Tax=Georgenia daeguensis TaxID=908355 RepID=A0ABP6UQA6_9MICO
MWTAYWTTSPRNGELRTEPGRTPGEGEALVRTLRSGVSRGTEMLVHAGAVPAAVARTMRAPFQEGELPGPVKYGYLSVGVVEEGPADLVGRRVFCLYPHQDRYVVPVTALTPVPDDVPSDRAVLAGSVETAVNALWDAAPRLGDRVAVVGAGMVGGAVAALLRTFPLDRLQLVDVDPARADLAAALGVEWVHPDDAAGECDLVIHCSASESGLARGLELLGDEGELIEMSWYGTREPQVPLGAAFHARRLSIRASQVGAVSAARRARRTTADRLALAMRLLADPAFDAFLTSRSDLAGLPAAMERLYAGGGSPLCHVVVYPESPKSTEEGA